MIAQWSSTFPSLQRNFIYMCLINTDLLLVSLFSYDKVLSTISKYHDGLPVCDYTDNFPNSVNKPHGHVHTSNLDLIDNTQPRSLMKKGANFRDTPSCSKYKLDNFYQDAIDKLITKLARHSKSESGIFTTGKILSFKISNWYWNN